MAHILEIIGIESIKSAFKKLATWSTAAFVGYEVSEDSAHSHALSKLAEDYKRPVPVPQIKIEKDNNMVEIIIILCAMFAMYLFAMIFKFCATNKSNQSQAQRNNTFEMRNINV